MQDQNLRLLIAHGKIYDELDSAVEEMKEHDRLSMIDQYEQEDQENSDMIKRVGRVLEGLDTLSAGVGEDLEDECAIVDISPSSDDDSMQLGSPSMDQGPSVSVHEIEDEETSPESANSSRTSSISTIPGLSSDDSSDSDSDSSDSEIEIPVELNRVASKNRVATPMGLLKPKSEPLEGQWDFDINAAVRRVREFGHQT